MPLLKYYEQKIDYYKHTYYLFSGSFLHYREKNNHLS